MLAAERHDRITAALQRGGAVKVADLAELLHVSEMTIRRDLDLLDDRAVLRKVHGGAILRGNRGVEPSSTVKAQLQHSAKVAIGSAASSMVDDHMTVAIGAGTTTLELARCLTGRSTVTVVTNSISIFQELTASAGNPTVFLTGGSRTPSDALVGPLATAALATFRVDIAFLGAHGIDADAGLTTPNIAEAETNQRLISTGRRLIVLADHTKYCEVGTSVFAPLSRIDTLITDDALGDDARAVLTEHISRVVYAPSEAT